MNTLRDAITFAAGELGISPLDLATVISYETAGTFDPMKAGPTTQWGQHRGLIQWGEPQARKYLGGDFSIPSQAKGIVAYMRDAGVQPGMGLLDVYSAVNAGRVGHYNASDANNGGAPGTVRDKVENQMAGHRRKAVALIGEAAPSFDPTQFGAIALDDTPAPSGGVQALDAMATGSPVPQLPTDKPTYEIAPISEPVKFDPAAAGAIPFDPVAVGAQPVDAQPQHPEFDGSNIPGYNPETGLVEKEQRGAFRRVDDAVRGVADMLTFGMADEISAGLGSLTGVGGQRGNYDANLEAQRARDAQGGAARFAGQVAGALAMPMRAPKTLAGAVGQGAALGGAYGFGSGEGGAENRLTSAAAGAAVGGAAGGAVRGLVNKLQTRAAAQTIPTNDQLRSTANAAYATVDDAGVIFKPEGVRRLAGEIKADLAEFGYHPSLQPRIAVVVNELDRLASGNVTMKGMDILRRIADNARKSADASEKALGNRIIGAIDDFMTDIGADDVLAGNAQEAAAALKEARNLWSRLRKSEMVDVAAMKAERRAASTGSGGNMENALRQNVRSLLDRPATSRGMNALERAAAERVVRGTVPQNALRQVGKLSPQGNGLMAALGVGGAIVNPALGAASLAGMAAKPLAERMTVKAAERLSQIIRSGGQSAKDLAALARQGEISIERVDRLEKLAASIGVSLPELAAAVREKVATGG